MNDDDYYRTPSGRAPTPPTFLGNHDMGRAASQLKSKGASDAELLQRVLLGYDLLYLLRGAPVVYYGDEVGMIGRGGDQQARQDMFPTQVAEWRTQERVGSPPIGTGSSFDVQSPIPVRLKELAALRDRYPVLSTGASYVRYAKNAVLVVQRVDLETGATVLTAFNNGTTAARVPGISTSGTSAWTTVDGSGGLAGGTVTIPPVADFVAAPAAPLAAGGPVQVGLTARPDDLTAYDALSATVPGVPASVGFAIRRHGGAWQRVAIDDSPPYRAFLDPARFRRHERVEGVAVARTFGGTVSVSQIATFVPHG
jgi:hypothetical protein